jgi:hypothetical protein
MYSQCEDLCHCAILIFCQDLKCQIYYLVVAKSCNYITIWHLKCQIYQVVQSRERALLKLNYSIAKQPAWLQYIQMYARHACKGVPLQFHETNM